MDKNLKLRAYVGTYTNGDSKGIYSFELDYKTGKIENVKLAAEVGNPTYLALSKNNRHLYSVAKLEDDGGVASFRINEDTHDLELINYKFLKENPPSHISLSGKDDYLFSSNYHKGYIKVYPIDEDGEIKLPSSMVIHEGSGPNKERQEKAHVHFGVLTPDGRYLCAVDLGMDKLVIYRFDNGNLKELEESSLSLQPGCGPRHMEFHPNKKFAYIITELSSEIIALEYSEINCKFKVLQYISTLTKEFEGENLGSAIHISSDGNYLYASNRGHDSIAAFCIDNSSGKLEFVSHTTTGGISPRDFAIDPTGNFIIVANQHSNNIVPFIIDKATGKLDRASDLVSIPNPVCIKFLNI